MIIHPDGSVQHLKEEECHRLLQVLSVRQDDAYQRRSTRTRISSGCSLVYCLQLAQPPTTVASETRRADARTEIAKNRSTAPLATSRGYGILSLERDSTHIYFAGPTRIFWRDTTGIKI
jgi:hypothetical protein